jgi:hypothetical protein
MSDERRAMRDERLATVLKLTTDYTDYTVFQSYQHNLHSMATRSFARWPTDEHGFFSHAKAQRGAKNGILT